MTTETEAKWRISAPTGCYIDGGQHTVEEGNLLVLDIARDLGYSGDDADESIDWLNSNCCDKNRYPLTWWGWLEGLFGQWDAEEDV